MTPSGGYDIVFQSSTNKLFLVQVPNPPPNGGSLSFTWTSEGLGMQPGTNPSLTILANGTPQWAFQASGTPGSLYVGSSNQGLPMQEGRSPTILPTPYGWQVAFEYSNTFDLWLDLNPCAPPVCGSGSNVGVGYNTGRPMN
jgi:hypothetical protein